MNLVRFFDQSMNRNPFNLELLCSLFSFFLVTFILCFANLAHASERGMFIWSLEEKPVLSSRQAMEKAVDFASRHGIKTLFVQVYRSNKAWFPSKVSDTAPYRDCLKSVREDPLAFLIKQAHAKGIEVHAWLNLLSLSGNKDAVMLKKYGPSILTRNVNPKKSLEDYKIDNQYFLEPSDSRVRHQLLLVVAELLRGYPELDGIQFDYIRYPDVHPFYGYSPDNVARFKQATGYKRIIDDDPAWMQWKRNQVTELLTMLVKKSRSINPRIHVSTTGCLGYTRALQEALQDWPYWLSSHLVEFVTVMNYPPDFAQYEKNIVEIKQRVKDFDRVNMAVGTYKFVHTPDIFEQQFKYCEQSGSRSCVIFHYNNFLENDQLEKVVEQSL